MGYFIQTRNRKDLIRIHTNLSWVSDLNLDWCREAGYHVTGNVQTPNMVSRVIVISLYGMLIFKRAILEWK